VTFNTGQDVPHGSSTTDFDYIESIRIPTVRDNNQRGTINKARIEEAKQVTFIL
jgi:hypothetical protein